MCKVTCFSDFRPPALLVVGPALGAQLWGGGGLGNKLKDPPSPKLQWAAGPVACFVQNKGRKPFMRSAVLSCTLPVDGFPRCSEDTY